MRPTSPENPLRVLLGTSFALFIAVSLALPIAYYGVAFYLSVTGVTLPIEISPSASKWEVRLNPEQTSSDEHELLTSELEAIFPAAAFNLFESNDESWLLIHAWDQSLFQRAHELIGERGFASGTIRLPGFLDFFEQRSIQAILTWFKSHPGAVMGAISSQSISFAIVGLILMWRMRKRSTLWADAPAPLGRRLLEGIVGGVVLVAASYLGSEISGLLGRTVEEQAWVLTILESGGESALVLWVLVVGFAPVGEELFFRGYLFQNLDVRVSRPLAFAVSTAYFAAVHGNPSGLLVYIFLGVGLAYLHARTKSLVAPVLAHALVNACVLAAH